MKEKLLYLDTYKSPIGELYILSVNNGLIALSFSKKEPGAIQKKYFRDYSFSTANKVNKLTRKQLDKYFTKKNVFFTIPLILIGTEFQKRVWTELMKIPYGVVITYKDLAEKIGLKKGYQAVGQANSKNKIPIIIPCHRVIAAKNKLGGYSAGLNKKIKLLEIEEKKL
jgi:methylated-DNA-[protein]-cysteine S-methyltransferase